MSPRLITAPKMTATLTRFRIEKLHGRRTIEIPIVDNRLVLVRTRLLSYLERVTNLRARPSEWKQVRQVCRELKRMPAKRYVRGKFEAWFILGFVRNIQESLSRMARETGGSISVNVQLADSNFVQLLVRALPAPTSLSSFLDFHFKQDSVPSEISSGIWSQIRSWFR